MFKVNKTKDKRINDIIVIKSINPQSEKNVLPISYLWFLVYLFLTTMVKREGHYLHAFRYLFYFILAKLKLFDKDAQMSLQQDMNTMFYDVNILQEISDDDDQGLECAKQRTADIQAPRQLGPDKFQSYFSCICTNRGFNLIDKIYPYPLILDFDLLRAVGKEIVNASGNDASLIDSTITKLAEAMLKIHQEGIYIRYESDGQVSACNGILSDFVDTLIDTDIVDSPENGPTINVDGAIYVNWIAILLKASKGDAKFKYQTGDNQYVHFWC